MRKFLRRIFYLFNRQNSDRELQQELLAHREMLPADRRPSFGNALKLREESRDAWGFLWLDQLRQDLAYGARQLRRSPGFTLTAVGVLALGIGANLAMAHIFNAAFFHRISVRDADSIYEFPPGLPYAQIAFYRDHTAAFSYAVAERTDASVFFDDDLEPERATFVSENYFADLAINPAAGRLLSPLDTEPSVVLGYGFWQRRFGGDPSVAGRTVHLNGQPVQIVGVAPQNFAGLSNSGPSGPPSLWLPMNAHPYLFVGSQALTGFTEINTEMFAKLKPGVSLGAAEAQLAALTAELRTQHPDQIPAREVIRGNGLMALPHDAFVPIIMVSVLVLLVLVTACANLGNILLARGQAREREIEVRIAVGAGAWRIVRQLMVENLLLASLGSVAGLVVGYFAAKTLLHVAEAPPGMQIVTDWRMVLAGGFLALLSAAVFGLAPAMQAVGKGSTKTERGAPTRARKILVAVQVGASCFLLIFASLLARTAQRQLAVDLRYDYQQLLVLDPQLSTHNLAGGAARQALDEIAARMERVPGVAGVTMSVFPPYAGRRAVDFSPGLPSMNHNEVAPSYFALMNLPLVRGRLFSSTEREVIVLSESAARAGWPNEDPLGKTLTTPRFNPMGQGKMMINGRDRRTIIGIVKDSQPKALEVYVPIPDANLSKTMLIAQVAGDPKGLLKDVRSAASLPGLVSSVWRMQSRVEQSAGPPPGVLPAIGSLGVTATLLAAIGLFGLMAFAVAQRTREIGLRIALGARPLDILETLIAQYAAAMVVGGAAGLVLAGGFALLFASLAYGFRAFDPLSYLLGLTIFAVVALAAILIPARRALRIDPASALRWE